MKEWGERCGMAARFVLVALLFPSDAPWSRPRALPVVVARAGESPSTTMRSISPEATANVTARTAKLPLRFEANAGQWDERVKFVTRQGGATLFITEEGMTFALRDVERPDLRPGAAREEEREARAKALREAKTAAVTVKLVGAQASAPRGEKELETKSNFFLGNDSSKWRTNVANYGQVRATSLPGVDVVWHGGDSGLEYDLEVAPGVDASAIELAVEGADKLGIAADGSLEAVTPAGTLTQRPPRVLQAGRELPSRYSLSGEGRVRFELEGYDARLAVLIDPAFAYSTYLGGSGGDEGVGIAVDANGCAYVAGTTDSVTFPKVSPLQPGFGGNQDVFVSKLNAAGSALVYSTYLGGSAYDSGAAIAVDGSGNAYLAGATESPNFPTQAALQPTYGGGHRDGFVAKLNAAGSAFVYSTYLGGSNGDGAGAIAVDANGNVYLAGTTASPNFPTESPFQAALGGVENTFVSKLKADGSAFVYSTYLGGEGPQASAIAVDGSGCVYLTGRVVSFNLPTKNPIQATWAGGTGDAFVSKLNAAGSDLVYSTYLGGSGGEGGSGIAVDASGCAYVTGSTNSADFPTQSPFQAQGRNGDAFVTKLNAAGSAFVYSTYLGGESADSGRDIAVDAYGSAYVIGETMSTSFPTKNAPQPTYGGAQDGFVSKLNPAGSALAYSTYLGGSSNSDIARRIALGADGSVYVTGMAGSTNFPTKSPLQGTYGGGPRDAFVTKLSRLGDSCALPSECPSGFCVDGVCCDGACGGGCDRCDLPGSLGSCAPAPQGDPGASPTCALPFVCDGVSAACPTSCATDAQCASAFYCAADGTCQPRKAQGSACDTQADCKAPGCRECTSGFCVDGVCCNRACDGQCEACDVAKGTCGTVTGAPHGARPACSAGLVCTHRSTSCESAPAGTCDCAPPATCDATGKCVTPAPDGGGGGGCNTGGVDGSWSAALLGAIVATVVLRKRRQRASPARGRR